MALTRNEDLLWADDSIVRFANQVVGAENRNPDWRCGFENLSLFLLHIGWVEGSKRGDNQVDSVELCNYAWTCTLFGVFLKCSFAVPLVPVSYNGQSKDSNTWNSWIGDDPSSWKVSPLSKVFYQYRIRFWSCQSCLCLMSIAFSIALDKKYLLSL